MEAHFIDSYLAPSLVPAIMVVNMYKKSDLIYDTVAAGTILSAISANASFHLNRSIRSRSKLTLGTAILLTFTTLASISAMHLIRLNHQPNSYELPFAIRDCDSQCFQKNVLRYHTFADIIPGLVIFFATQLCSLIQYELHNRARRKFKFGEASIVAQLASATFLTWSLTTYSKVSGAGPFQVNLATDIVLQLAMAAFAIILLPSYLFVSNRSSSSRAIIVLRYGLLGIWLSVSYTAAKNLISATSKLDPLTWLVDHIFSTHQRISLFSLWLSTVTACVSFSTSWSRTVGQTNSMVRKVFHLAIGIVFITGYNQDIEFTQFAAGGMLIVLFLLEVIRAWNLPPLGQPLEKVCVSLRGGWDNKYITMSHIYLMIGTFIPLWLLRSGSSKLSISSGLISLGVGDSAAALIGTFFGSTKIKSSSNKTLEGLFGNICAMIIFKIIWIGYTDFNTEYSFVIAAVLTAIIEALMTTCDNLILPLVMTLLVELL